MFLNIMFLPQTCDLRHRGQKTTKWQMANMCDSSSILFTTRSVIANDERDARSGDALF